jgi:hypothetical protein
MATAHITTSRHRLSTTQQPQSPPIHRLPDADGTRGVSYSDLEGSDDEISDISESEEPDTPRADTVVPSFDTAASPSPDVQNGDNVRKIHFFILHSETFHFCFHL